jgi:hypothetical protein
MAPDNSSLTWIFDGAHRNLFFHSPLHNREWKVRINDAPGVDGYEVYHPRWANRFRFLAMTGPYKSGEGDNRIRAGGKGVEIYAGRFDPTLTRVEQWVRVTRNQAADFFPDIWIDPSGATASTGVSSAMSDASILPPEDVAARSLIVEARLLETTAIPSPKSIAPYRNALVIYRYKPERIIRGTYQKSSLDVAHWGLRDGQAQPLRRKKGDLYQLILELLDSRKDLKGERVVMDFPDSGQPIYIEVNP